MVAFRFLLPLLYASIAGAAISDTPFPQEYRTEVPYPADIKGSDVRAVATDGDAVWIATRAGAQRYRAGSWISLSTQSCYALQVHGGSLWAGCWDGLHRFGEGEKIAGIDGPVVALWSNANELLAATPTSLHQWNGRVWTALPWNGSKAVRGLARDGEGALWVATGMGAWRLAGDQWTEFHDESQLLSGELRAIAAAPDGSVWLGGTGGVDVYRAGRRIASYSEANGLAWQSVHALAAEPSGTVWIGTDLGAMRRTGDGWSLRHSRRWLPSDHVLSIAPAADGTVWIATTAGLSAIHRRSMTLAEKAAHYLEVCQGRHVRPPGLVEQCDLEKQGDVATYRPRDDDNDGQYTSMYLAMESYRYAATRDPQARDHARAAFRALRFLQQVTGTRGFVARTVVPSSWTQMHDGNTTFSAQQRADRLVSDPRAKPVENRWRPSADGKWLWKGDTSSDETTGHMFGYFVYYEFAADEAERVEIRDLVRRIVDHIVDGGYTFRDIDGQPTRWGMWAPESLNHHPDWRAERWTNGLEILSYLRAAEHITGDPQYRQHYLKLIRDHGYDRLARRPLATEPSERTHFDNELVALALPAALTEKQPPLRAIFEDALEFWLPRVRAQRSSYFTFTWAALSGRPDAVEIAGAVESLRDEPLDLVQWTVDNRTRRDLKLVREPQIEELQVDRILPPSERATMRWDGNPWSAVHGENGMSESSGVHWLLPYWMGRAYGFIAAP